MLDKLRDAVVLGAGFVVGATAVTLVMRKLKLLPPMPPRM